MTKAEFTFENRLKHDDLDEIYSELSDQCPYWDHTLVPSKMIEVIFPDREPGYYVVEVDWIVADTTTFVASFIVEHKDEVTPIGLLIRMMENVFNVIPV